MHAGAFFSSNLLNINTRELLLTVKLKLLLLPGSSMNAIATDQKKKNTAHVC